MFCVRSSSKLHDTIDFHLILSHITHGTEITTSLFALMTQDETRSCFARVFDTSAAVVSTSYPLAVILRVTAIATKSVFIVSTKKFYRRRMTRGRPETIAITARVVWIFTYLHICVSTISTVSIIFEISTQVVRISIHIYNIFISK